jgi:hypothetical protein
MLVVVDLSFGIAYRSTLDGSCNLTLHHHHYHKHQGLDPLIRSVSRVTNPLASVFSVFQLFFFLVVCSDMILKGFSLVVFFASVKASSVCIRLSCLVCCLSVVHGVRSHLFCGHKGCSLPEVSITSFLPPQFFVSVRLSESNFLTHIKMYAKLKCFIFALSLFKWLQFIQKKLTYYVSFVVVACTLYHEEIQ